MNTKLLTLPAIAALSLALLSAPALAGKFSHGYGHRAHHGHHYAAPFAFSLGKFFGGIYRHGQHYGYGKHGVRRHYRHGGHGYVKPYAGRGYAKPHHKGAGYAHRDRCQQTSKTGYHHGRKAQIGGTMCYDRHGRWYIVPGSRYVMHYYD